MGFLPCTTTVETKEGITSWYNSSNKNSTNYQVQVGGVKHVFDYEQILTYCCCCCWKNKHVDIQIYNHIYIYIWSNLRSTHHEVILNHHWPWSSIMSSNNVAQLNTTNSISQIIVMNHEARSSQAYSSTISHSMPQLAIISNQSKSISHHICTLEANSNFHHQMGVTMVITING